MLGFISRAAEIAQIVASFIITLAGIASAAAAGTVIWDKARGKDPLKRYVWALKPIDWLGRFSRSHIIASDREGSSAMSRADRETIQALAESGQDIKAFGANINSHFAGTQRIANAQYFQPTHISRLTFGDAAECRPYTPKRIFNVSGISLGAASVPATMAYSRGAAEAGAYVNIGEGGFHAEAHKAGNEIGQCEIVFQVGTDKNSVRSETGDTLDDDKLRTLVQDNPEIVMIEIKLIQGAIPGEGGHLAAAKVTPLIAQIRGRKPGEDCNALDHQVEIENDEDLARFIDRVRKVTGLPTGFKTSYSRREHIESQFSTFKRLGIYPDFITLDGGEGGTGKGPSELINHVGALLSMSLPMLVDVRREYGLEDRIRIIASGRLFTPFKGAVAISMGADFIVSARGVMTAGGCIGQEECHKGTCKKGITTQNPALTAGFNVEAEGHNVARYIAGYEKSLIKLAHAAGKADVRDLTPADIDITLNNGITTIPMSDFYAGLKKKTPT